MANLNEIILEPQSLRQVNFFNGRLLTAEDLRQEQSARSLLDGRLGRALGHGIAYGLEVSKVEVSKDSDNTKSQLVLNVTPGLAINHKGRSLELSSAQELQLLYPQSVTSTPVTFKVCDQQVLAATDATVFLLLLCPAEKSEGRAAMNGLGGSATCGAKYQVEGLRFRLVGLDPYLAEDLKDTEHLQNLLAYRCFGSFDSAWTGYRSNPFTSPPGQYGLLDELYKKAALTLCDVPLAVIHWKPSQDIHFIDTWSVRRRITHAAAHLRWHPLLGDRRLAEAEATLCQLEDQLAAQLGTNQEKRVASSFLRYLPPAGLLPVGPGRFDYHTFFTGLTLEVTPLDPARVRQVLHESLYLEPIDLEQKPPLRIFTIPNSEQYVLFLRDDRIVNTLPPPDEEPPPETEVKGRVIVGLVDGRGQLVDPKVVGGVWLEDERGNTYPAKLVPYDDTLDFKTVIRLGCAPPRPEGRNGLLLYSRASLVATYHYPDKSRATRILTRNIRETVTSKISRSSKVLWLAEGLAPGSYLLKAEARGYRVASESIKLGSGEQLTVALCLSPSLATESGWPGTVFVRPNDEIVDLRGNRYSKVVMPERLTVVPYPPEDWDNPPRIKTPPEVEDMLQELLEQDPAAPITVRNPKLVIASEYSPDQPSPNPYAYLVTSNERAIPVVLVPSEKAVPGELATSRAALLEFRDSTYETRLASSTLGQMDVFGAAWGGLVSEVLGVSINTGNSLIADVADFVTQAKEERAYYPGLSVEINTALKEAGFDTDAKLANADKATIKTVLEEAEIAVSESYLTRLIEQARGFVPETAWSLGTGSLGLTEHQFDRIRELGLASLGDVKRVLDDEQRATEFQERLGLNLADIETVKAKVDEQLTLSDFMLSSEIPLNKLARVNSAALSSLVAAGYTTSKLANTEAETVAAELNIKLEEAGDLVKSAVERTLVEKANFTTKQATTLTASVGAVALGKLTLEDFQKLRLGEEKLNAAAELSSLIGKIGRRF